MPRRSACRLLEHHETTTRRRTSNLVAALYRRYEVRESMREYGPKHGLGLLPLASIDSGDSWPPTPKARKISCGRLSLVTGAALLIVISAVSTLTAMAWLSDGLADVNDEVPKPLATRFAAAARPFKRMQNALLRRIENPGGNASCVDKDSECIGWAQSGECKSNPGFMNVQCARSCGLCTATEAKFDPNCDDKSSFCGQWAAVGECGAWPRPCLEGALLASVCARPATRVRVLPTNGCFARRAASRRLKPVVHARQLPGDMSPVPEPRMP